MTERIILLMISFVLTVFFIRLVVCDYKDRIKQFGLFMTWYLNIFFSIAAFFTILYAWTSLHLIFAKLN